MKCFVRFFTLATFYLSALSLHAMEEEPMERGLIVQAPMPKTVTLKTADGQITLYATQAKRFKTIKHLIEDFPSETTLEVDVSTLYDPHLKTPTIESIKTLITFIENPTMSQNLDQMQLGRIFNAADFLEAPKSIRHELARKLLPLLMATGNRRIFNNLPYSIQSIQIAQKFGGPVPAWLAPCLAAEESFFIDLSNKNLESLDGIEKLASLNTKTININNNKLKNLELKKIQKVFPNIWMINANNNKIKKLSKKDIGAFSGDLHIDLRNNLISHIEKVHYFITPRKIFIDLRNNPHLTSTALHNLSSLLFPPRPLTFINNNEKALMAIMFTVFILCLARITYITEINKQRNDDFRTSLGALLSFCTIMALATHAGTNHSFLQNTIALDPGISYLTLKAKEKRAREEKTMQNTME